MRSTGECPFKPLERIVNEDGKRADDQAALEDKGEVVGLKSCDDDLAKRLGRDGRADRARRETDHDGKADARQDHRQRQRKLDPEEALAPGHSRARAASITVGRQRRQTGQGIFEESAEGRRGRGDQGGFSPKPVKSDRKREDRHSGNVWPMFTRLRESGRNSAPAFPCNDDRQLIRRRGSRPHGRDEYSPQVQDRQPEQAALVVDGRRVLLHQSLSSGSNQAVLQQEASSTASTVSRNRLGRVAIHCRLAARFTIASSVNLAQDRAVGCRDRQCRTARPQKLSDSASRWLRTSGPADPRPSRARPPRRLFDASSRNGRSLARPASRRKVWRA